MSTTLFRRLLTFLSRRAVIEQCTSAYSREFDMGKENKRLLRLIKKHDLTSQQVAQLCRVTTGTVGKWRQAEDTVAHRNMPAGYLELLEIKLGEK